MSSFKWNPHKDCDRFPCCCWWMATQVRWRADKIEYLQQEQRKLYDIYEHPYRYIINHAQLTIYFKLKGIYNNARYIYKTFRRWILINREKRQRLPQKVGNL